jgi:hypothetical protein
MKGKLINKYNTVSESTGRSIRVYTYKVHSYSADELAEFQLTQGANYRSEEGTGEPLFFTTNFEGNNVEIVRSKSYDPQTGQLVDAFKSIGSEDFELKRSMLEGDRRAAESTTPRIAPNRRALVNNDAKL